MTVDEAPDRERSVLDIVLALCVFAAGLPPYARATKRLPPAAQAVRAALLAAREPSTLLFRDLPLACGFPEFGDRSTLSDEIVVGFVSTLRQGLDDLRRAYPSLLDKLRRAVGDAFDQPEVATRDVRTQIGQAAERLLLGVNEARLRGFCFRLADRELAEVLWLEALGGFVMGRPPTSWSDVDLERFGDELTRLARLYRRVEAAAFDGAMEPGTFTARVAVTFRDGHDISQVVHLSRSEEHLAGEMADQIRSVMRRSRRVGLAAATRVLWQELTGELAADGPASE